MMRRADERRRVRRQRLRLRRLLQQVGHGDDRREGRVLHHVDGIGRDRRNDDLQRLRQDDVAHQPPGAQADRVGGLELALGHSLDAGAEDLGRIGSGNEAQRGGRGPKRRQPDARRRAAHSR